MCSEVDPPSVSANVNFLPGWLDFTGDLSFFFAGEVCERASAIVASKRSFDIVEFSSCWYSFCFCFWDDERRGEPSGFLGEEGVFGVKKSVICFAGDCTAAWLVEDFAGEPLLAIEG